MLRKNKHLRLVNVLSYHMEAFWWLCLCDIVFAENYWLRAGAAADDVKEKNEHPAHLYFCNLSTAIQSVFTHNSHTYFNAEEK